jgi:murein DD-endopeptidase MepM/ murein hydrolase activator NlpD
LFSLFSCKQKEFGEVALAQDSWHKSEQFGFNFNDFNVLHDTINSGDTFGSILETQNLGQHKVYDVIQKIKDSFNVRTVKVGKPYIFLRSKDRFKQLYYAIYQPDRANYYIIDFKSLGKVYKVTRPISYKKRTIAGELKGSFSEELQRQKVDVALVNKLIKVYAWSIDFFKLKKGDQFGVIFTERYIDDSIYDGVDSLKAAFFEYKGTMIYAFAFAQNKGEKIEYYNEEGQALKNSFLKSPLKYANITSRFSSNRFHPLQMIWKAHNGTDYAAPTGTPIMTTAAGTVEQTGYSAGNGNFVKVKHDKTYSTQYLHMSRILVRRGQQVTQGSIIGNVGSTGLATGPHVCYRFWKNGVQVDALKLKLPNSQPMEKNNLSRFKQQIEPLKWELDSVANL